MSQDAIFERTRAYQQEMFERSMEGNRIIVVGQELVKVTILSYWLGSDGYWHWEDTSVSMEWISKANH